MDRGQVQELVYYRHRSFIPEYILGIIALFLLQWYFQNDFDLRSVNTYIKIFIFFGLAYMYVKHMLAEQQRILHQLNQEQENENQE